MSAPPAIEIEQLGKAFAVTRGPREDTLVGLLASPRRLLGLLRARRETFWALRDASLTVRGGETLGVVGRNGAGKSTLLKLLARITPPTEGRARIRGRVGALLEVGTGFHRELTGRENVFLNGAILGMSRREIRARFGEIAEFAGVERFLETPIKRYSSGMRTRLAFAVAAHLQPEVLLVDEVLAVGDVEFQRRCLSRMSDVARAGRTVVFVSHNLSAVQQLCTQVLWLEGGSVAALGDAGDVIPAYLRAALPARVDGAVTFDRAPRAAEIVFRKVALHDAQADQAGSSRHVIELEYEVSEPVQGAIVVRIDAASGEPVATLRDTDLAPEAFRRKPGRYLTRCALPTRWLKPGSYLITVIARDMSGRIYDLREHVLELELLQDPSVRTFWNRAGFLLLPTEFATERLASEVAP